jgi:hypothetical protein
MTLPFSADQDEAVRLFVSLLLRPIVSPATERDPQKTMEIRFFAPGSLVSNLDFVESIFGNVGDPYLPENDAALDVMHWTGHTGCVIVVPHLAGMKKKELGLPHDRDATERQRRDGMCWSDPDEPYNGGGAFKVACRDERGVMVTIIADNYYGYCKKEVKTQISYAANLYGLCEEEHAGGAIAFATYVLGQDFRAANAVSSSLTGKSPSTTGFGSEGALTKAPFNALWPVVDLNNAFLSAILTGYAGFTTSAGYVGPKVRVDHDISMLVPEIWCRMRVHERDPRFHDLPRPARTGRGFSIWRTNGSREPPGVPHHRAFADRFLGRFFETPDAVSTVEILRPEKQSLELFAAGVEAIVEAQRLVALNYFEDGSVEAACPPLKALLHVLAQGAYEKMQLDDPSFRELFDRGAVLQSDWYQERMRVKQERDTALWRRHVAALDKFRQAGIACEFDVEERTREAWVQLGRVSSAAYLNELHGTIGADPFRGDCSSDFCHLDECTPVTRERNSQPRG